MPNPKDDSELHDLIKYLKANLMLQVRILLDDDTDEEKPEILLHRAGFSYKEIANITGKNYEAVKKTVARAQKDNKEGES